MIVRDLITLLWQSCASFNSGVYVKSPEYGICPATVHIDQDGDIIIEMED